MTPAWSNQNQSITPDLPEPASRGRFRQHPLHTQHDRLVVACLQHPAGRHRLSRDLLRFQDGRSLGSLVWAIYNQEASKLAPHFTPGVQKGDHRFVKHTVLHSGQHRRLTRHAGLDRLARAITITQDFYTKAFQLWPLPGDQCRAGQSVPRQ